MTRRNYFVAQFSILALFYSAIPFITPQEAPPPVKCVAMTPEAIQAQVEHEFKQRAYDAAEDMAARVMRRNGCSDEYAEAIAQAAVDNHLNVRVFASLAYVESSCRADVVSGAKSVGLTQINPKVWHYTPTELMDPYKNAQIGASILADYVHRYGLKEGLHRYNGLGDPTDGYATKVLTHAGLIA